MGPFIPDWYMIFWVVIAVIAICAIFFRYRESVSRDRTIQSLAEKGQAIPPELLHGGYYRGYGYWRYCRRPHRAGIILIFVGVAIFLSSAGHRGFDPDNWHDWATSGALFPLLIGLALVISGMFDRFPPPPPPPTP